MTSEKRRYFRINETLGVSYEFLDKKKQDGSESAVDIWDLMSDQDELIEHLLNEVGESMPKVAELARAINQKLERIVNQVVLESKLTGRLATRVQEVNISACGAGFICDQSVAVGTALQLEFQLLPGTTKVQTKGRIIGCEPLQNSYYWRLDFVDIAPAEQELLIQHIVKRQTAQLRVRRTIVD